LDRNRATKQFYDFVWPHRSDVLRVARFLCRDHSVADDLAQETLTKAFRALDRGIVTGTELKSWLLAILRNAWKDRLRATHSEMGMEALTEEPESGPAHAADGDAFRTAPQLLLEAFSDQEIIDALQQLPEDIRWTLLLVDVEGIGIQEAAEVLQVPSGTVKSRAHRGRRMLRTSLLPVARDRRLIADGVTLSDHTDHRQEDP
jgi:RNA polymerase sigma-70 factor (ECF subfamily)